MMRRKNEIGNRYNKLLVISFYDIKLHKARWLCECDCGKETIVFGVDLRRNRIKSCGCLREKGKNNSRFKHGLSNTKEYFCASSSRRRASIKNQTPILTELEKKKVMLYYQIASYLGEDWQVDHIQPISKGGLHHPDNLQVISKEENFKKHTNKDYIPNYSFRIDNLKEL